MPYISDDKNRRRELWREEHIPDTAGELNFIISKYLDIYLWQHGKSYQTINDILGALEGAKMEFYRRVAAPYEDIKIKENGDVYED